MVENNLIDDKLSILEYLVKGLIEQEGAESLNCLWGFTYLSIDEITDELIKKIVYAIDKKDVIHKALFIRLFREEKKVLNENETLRIVNCIESNKQYNVYNIEYHKIDILCSLLESEYSIIQYIALYAITQSQFVSKTDDLKNLEKKILAIEISSNKEIAQQCLRNIILLENSNDINNQLQIKRNFLTDNITNTYKSFENYLTSRYKKLFDDKNIIYDLSKINFNLSQVSRETGVVPSDFISFYKSFFSQNYENGAILLLGNVGMGKTTFTKWLAYFWASSSITNSMPFPFSWVFLIKLRDVVFEEENLSLEKLIKIQCFNGENEIGGKNTYEAITEILHHNGSQVLVILDGYNELGCYLDKQSKKIKQFEEELLQNRPCHILMTTRPHYLTNYHFDALYQLEALNSSQIKNAISLYLPVEQAECIINIYDKNKSIQQFMRIPIYLMLICMAIKSGKINGGENLSLSDILEAYLSETIGSDEIVGVLEKIAFHSNKLQTISFTSNQLENDTVAIKDVYEKLSNISFLQVQNINNNNEYHYQFIYHLIQEILSAKYLARKFNQKSIKEIEFIAKKMMDPYFQNIVSLVPLFIPTDQVEEYFMLLLQNHIDEFGFYKCLLLIKIIHYIGMNAFACIKKDYQGTIKKTIILWMAKSMDNNESHLYINNLLWGTLSQYPAILMDNNVQDFFKASIQKPNNKQLIVDIIVRYNFQEINLFYNDILNLNANIKALEINIQSVNHDAKTKNDKPLHLKKMINENDFDNDIQILFKIIEHRENIDIESLKSINIYFNSQRNGALKKYQENKHLEELKKCLLINFKKYFNLDEAYQYTIQDQVMLYCYINIFNVILVNDKEDGKFVNELKKTGETYIDETVFKQKSPALILIDSLIWMLNNFYKNLPKNIISNIEGLYLISNDESQNQILLAFLRNSSVIKFSSLKTFLFNHINICVKKFEWSEKDRSIQFLIKDDLFNPNISIQKTNILLLALLLGKWSCINKDIVKILIYIATNSEGILSFEHCNIAKSILSRIDIGTYIGELDESGLV